MTDEAWLEPLSPPPADRSCASTPSGGSHSCTTKLPVVLPVNYRSVETSGKTWVALRTRPGNVIEHEAMKVAFEIDGTDAANRQGWSVLVRGTLHHVDADAAGSASDLIPNLGFCGSRRVAHRGPV